MFAHCQSCHALHPRSPITIEASYGESQLFTRLIIYVCRLFGFLLGSTITGAGVYYYVLEEYKVSNELLTEDIYVRVTI